MTQHYVYLYRDANGKAQYVGYGEKDTRATTHQSNTHNPKLEKLIANNKFTLEIAGPFGTRETGLAVEAALISALNPVCNEKKGHSEWSFRPISVPHEYSERLVLPPLKRSDFIQSQGKDCFPVIFVIMTADRLRDSREGYSVSKPPKDSLIVKRAEAYWQLGRYVEGWAANPESSPGLLIVVNGKPGAQIVIASLIIAQDEWCNVVEEKFRLIQIPLQNRNELDAFGLRGRRIDKEAGIKFGPKTNDFFKILKCTSSDLI